MEIKEETILYENEIPYNVSLYDISYIMPHFHRKELELIFCMEGHVNLVAGHQKVRINSGEVFSVDYGDIHYIYSDVPNKTILFHLDLTKLDIPWKKLSCVYFSCESIHCYPYQIGAMNDIKDILFTLTYVKYSDSPEYGSLPNSLIRILLKYFNWFNYENPTSQMNIDLYERFYRILRYCHENYDKKISISQLADSEHINRNYFSQFISKTVFRNFSNMIKYIRCYEAEQLLLKTDLPVSEISYSCGFSDNKYFYSAFKKWWKVTPAEHRANYMEYMKNDTKIATLDNNDAKDSLRSYITKWHIEKTLTFKSDTILQNLS